MKSGAIVLLLAVATTVAVAAPSAPNAPLPARLSETGLYRPGSTAVVQDGVIAFSPQYPLWSDGTRKRRWIQLPPGTTIDASQSTPGSFHWARGCGRSSVTAGAIETRMIERLADGVLALRRLCLECRRHRSDLAPEDGAVVAVADAPDGRYGIPLASDCVACHEGAAVPVLGFSAHCSCPRIAIRSRHTPIRSAAEYAI